MMKHFNPKEGSTWAGLGIILMSLSTLLASTPLAPYAPILAGIATICGGVSGVIPDKKLPTVK